MAEKEQSGWTKILRGLDDFRSVVGAALASIDPTTVAAIPQQRDISLERVHGAIWSAVNALDVPSENLWYYLTDLYFANNDLYALINQSGKLYRTQVSINGDNVELGELVHVEVFFEPAERMQVRQREDGRYEGFAILCTATLNKNGVVDSRGLFDSFVERFEGGGREYINVLHMGREASRIGEIKGVFRHEKMLVGYLVFDDSLMGQATGRTLAADEEGIWGGSIEFEHYGDFRLVDFGDGIELPVSTDGKLLGYSIAQSVDGAAWYTGNFIERRIFMQPGDRDYEIALAMAGGDEAAVAELAGKLEQVRTQLDGSITYTTGSSEAGPGADVGQAGSNGATDDREDSAHDARLAALEGEVAALRNALMSGGLADGDGDEPLLARMVQLETRISAVASAHPEAETVFAERLKPLGERVDSRLAAVDQSISGINLRLSQIAYRLDQQHNQIIDAHETGLPPQPEARHIERPRHQTKPAKNEFVESDLARRMREHREGKI